MQLETTSVVEALAAELQRRILDSSIPAGAKLTELSIAQEFTVARPTAKAAIEHLVHRGIVRRGHHRTARVPVLDAADVADLYFSRAVVETATVEALALRRTPIDQARHACEALKQTSEENSGVLPFVQWDVKFHRALVDAVRSPRLRRMHDAVMGEVELCMAQVQVHQLLDPSVIVAEHEGILAATIAGDSPAAVRLMRAHLEAASTELQRYLSERDAAVGHSADG